VVTVTHKSYDHLLAPTVKKLILKWVNDDRDPEEIYMQKEVAGLPPELTDTSFYYMRYRKQQLRAAFETDNEYNRDWFLFMARYSNAVIHAPLGPQVGALPGMTPIAKNLGWDAPLAFVQKRLADKMAVCKRSGCKKYFFRTRKGQQYCKRECSRIVKRALNLNWYHTSPSSRKNVA
jgi:hypothetical protein